MNTSPQSNSEHYAQNISYKHRERMVGLFVFSGFLLFLLFILISVKNQHLFEQRVMFYIEVNSSEGISPGNVVTALGTEVGLVSSLKLVQEHKIRVTIEVYEGQRNFIRTGAKAVVNRLTNIGNALIEIQSASIDAPVLVAGSLIPVEETPSLNDLLLGLANLVQSADNNNLLSKFEVMLPKLELTLENVHEIITQIASGHGVLGAAIFDKQVEKELKVVVKSGAEILSEAEGIITIAKDRLLQLQPVLNDAKYMTHDLRGTTENLPAMINELNDIVAQVKTALTLLNGELESLPGVALDARTTLNKTNRLLDSVQNTWPLSNDQSTSKAKQLLAPHPSYE